MRVPGEEHRLQGRGLMRRLLEKRLIENGMDPQLASGILEETCDPTLSMEENWNLLLDEIKRRGLEPLEWKISEEECYNV